MTGFPGSIYDGDGKSLDPTVPHLLQEQLDDHPHLSLLTDRDAAPIILVWRLAEPRHAGRDPARADD